MMISLQLKAIKVSFQDEFSCGGSCPQCYNVHKNCSVLCQNMFYNILCKRMITLNMLA